MMQMPAPALSIIIPFYENAVELMECINSLIAMLSGAHLVQFLVQDDASPTVNAFGLVPPCAATVERNETNLGFPGNCNAGAQRALAPLLFFVNQDILADGDLSKGWDHALISAFQNPQVGIVGVRLLTPELRIQHAGGGFDVNRSPYHFNLGATGLDSERVNIPKPVTWVTGAALAVRKLLFTDLKGFDEEYIGGYFEDVDLCLRAGELGRLVFYEPRCTLIHKTGTTGGNPNFGRNLQLFRERWAHKIQPDTQMMKAGF